MRQDAMFAAAADFSHLIDDDFASSSSLADMIGSDAVSRRDNAGMSRGHCVESHTCGYH